MNPLIKEAVESVSLGWVAAVMTVLFFGAFLFWTWWAYSAHNRARFEADSQMPLNDGGES